MMVDHILTYTFPAAYSLLPAAMRSDKATSMLIAIGLHESGFTHRRQINGSAHGWFQFERVGTRGVLEHPRTTDAANAVIDALGYRLSKATVARQSLVVYDAVIDNDTLACCFARLLLWTLPAPLPGPDASDLAWGQYVASWRPGKPHPETWAHQYAEAWARVTALGGTTT